MRFSLFRLSSFSDALATMPATRITRLPSGLAVATQSMPSLATATIGVWISSGSRAETLESNGVAHFLEHILFKGTKTCTQADLERRVENMGANLNAYTSREQTAYFVKVFSQDASVGVEMIGDLVTNAVLSEQAIQSERDVILREVQEIENNMEETLFDHLHAAAYQKSSLGFRILGPPSNISKFKRNDLVTYICRHYLPERMVVVGVGNLDHEKLCLDVEKAFVNLPKAKFESESYEKPEFVGSEVRIRVDAMPTAHLAIAVESCGWTSEDYWPMQLASTMIGSFDRTTNQYPTTRLAQQISGLASSYMSFNTTYTDTGLWGIYMATNNRLGMADLVKKVIQAWTELSVAPSAAELERAKQMLKTALLLRQDGTTAVAEEIGMHMLVWGRKRSNYELCKAIDSVTINDIKRVALKYIYDKDPATVSIGPIEAFPDYNEIRSKMALWRY